MFMRLAGLLIVAGGHAVMALFHQYVLGSPAAADDARGLSAPGRSPFELHAARACRVRALSPASSGRRIVPILSHRFHDFTRLSLVVIALLGLAAGSVAYWLGRPDVAALGGGDVAALIALAVEIVVCAAVRSGSISSRRCRWQRGLAFDEPLAANVVALMYSGGQLLEIYARDGRGAEVTLLRTGRAHRAAMRAG